MIIHPGIMRQAGQIKPVLRLDFLSPGASLDSRATFTGDNTRTSFNSAGLLVTAGTNAARLDYNPATLAPLGLLIEQAVTNLALYSRDFTNAAWVKVNVTAAKTPTGIDGAANSASLLTATAGNSTVLQTFVLSSAARTFSLWIKRITGSGEVDLSQDGVTWTAVTVTSAWTRVTLTATQLNPVVGLQIVTSGDAIAVDYSQLEAGTFATSAILTTSATVAKAADVCSILTSAFAFNASQGALFIRAMRDYSTSSATFPGMLSLFGGAPGTDLIDIYTNTNSRGINARVFVGGVASIDAAAGASYTVGAAFKAALAFAANDFAASANGSACVTSSSGALPTVTTLGLGAAVRFQTIGRLYIQQAAYYSTRLSNTQLQALTAN